MITIVPGDKIVLIEGRRAHPVNMNSVDPEIHAIQFNTELEKGYVEYVPNEKGIIPPLEEITDLSPWAIQVTQAENILYCHDNPKTFYRTNEPVGSPVVVRSEGWPQPPDTTEVPPPPKPSGNCNIYWDGSEFVWSCFPIEMDLDSAKEYISDQISKEAYKILFPTDWLIVREIETSIETPEEIKIWRAEVRSTANSKVETCKVKNSIPELRDYCESQEFLTWPTLQN